MLCKNDHVATPSWKKAWRILQCVFSVCLTWANGLQNVQTPHECMNESIGGSQQVKCSICSMRFYATGPSLIRLSRIPRGNHNTVFLRRCGALGWAPMFQGRDLIVPFFGHQRIALNRIFMHTSLPHAVLFDQYVRSGKLTWAPRPCKGYDISRL
jgi:hypothetical protein